MASSNNLDALFADGELPFGHPGRRFDDTPAYFEDFDDRYEPPQVDPPEEGMVHYGPGGRPLCGTDSHLTVHTDDPHPGGRLPRLPRAGGGGSQGQPPLHRSLPAPQGADQRPRRRGLAQGGPEALPPLRQSWVVVELELAHGIQKCTYSPRQVPHYDNYPLSIERLYV